ncbi:MAG: acyl--CoA ligase [Armatimonadetes bacterium]|nr:acyl--CoA ligase [Armatimonadota bacterium]MDE2206409.1 acyl--CoA ligase [Armatimonadota bacterium]
MSSESYSSETAGLIASAQRLSSGVDRKAFTPWQSIGSLLSDRSHEADQASWLTWYREGKRAGAWTRAEFFDLASRLAHALHSRLNLAVGSRIGTLMANDPDTVLVYFAAWIAGMCVVPVNAGEEEDNAAFVLENAEAAAVFVLPSQLDRARRLMARLPAVGRWIIAGPATGDLESLTDLLNAPPANLPEVPKTAEALIVYTSGTTGAPKGVVLDQADLLNDALSIADWHGFTSRDRAFCILPIHHVNGVVVTLMTPLVSGGSVVLNDRFRAHTFWYTLRHEHCTWASVVPTVLAFLCAQPRLYKRSTPSVLRHVICGAGPLTTGLAKQFHDLFGVRVVHGYGLSETTCYSCFLPPLLDENAYVHWMFECGFPSIGCAISANDMAIHNAAGEEQPEDERGEIVVRGANVMQCYYKRPQANADAFAHGWFRTGDEGFWRPGPDGSPYYFITGRIKELIIRGGVNYSPFDIDEVLATVPGVKAAMAVGFDNDFYGEEIGAYVQPEEPGSLTEQDVIIWCRERLPFAKCPKVVVFGETFPVTSTGKYQRIKLKPLFEQWKSTQFKAAG